MTVEPTMDECPFGDPTCPCQDGDLCHYVDDSETGTLAMMPPLPHEGLREEPVTPYVLGRWGLASIPGALVGLTYPLRCLWSGTIGALAHADRVWLALERR